MDLHHFVYSAVFLLSVTVLAVLLFKRAGLGSLLGLLVAGIIVGPHFPGPTIAEDVDSVRQFTELGVVFLLFTIGLEMQPHRLWAMRRYVFGLGSLQVLLTGVILTGYALLFVLRWQAAILVGFALALSSTAFVMQLLQEHGELNTKHGSTAFAVLLLQDLAVVPLLAVLPLLGGGSLAFPVLEQAGLEFLVLVCLVMAGIYVIPNILKLSARHHNTDAFWMTVLLAVFGAAAASEYSGLSMALGAFVMGMLLSGSPYHYQIAALMEPYKGLLMGLFFVAVGMSVDLQTVVDDVPTFMRHVAMILLLKILVLYFLCLKFDFGHTTSLRTAFLLSQSGEFGFVLFSAAKLNGIISDKTFALLIATVSVSMLLTPLLLKVGEYFGKYLSVRPSLPPEMPAKKAHVVVIGYGRVGRIVCTMLQSQNIPFIALDTNPERVAMGKHEKRPVFYGDALNPKLLTAVGIEHARLAVMATHDVKTEVRLFSHLHTLAPGLPIVARAWDLASRDRLMLMGVTEALPVAVEGSLQVGAAVLKQLNIDEGEIRQLVESLREDYSLIRPPGG